LNGLALLTGERRARANFLTLAESRAFRLVFEIVVLTVE